MSMQKLLLVMSLLGANTALNLNPAVFEKNVTDYVNRELSGGNSGIAIPFVDRSVRQSFLALDDAGRAAVVRELGAAAKAIVMSPAFDSAYKAMLKSQYKAVDHGVKVAPATITTTQPDDMEKQMQNQMRAQFRKMALDMQKQVDTYNAEAIQMMVESFVSQLEVVPPNNAAERAMQAKAKTLYAEAGKLAGSNLPEARNKFKAALLSGFYVDPSNAAGAEADQLKIDQQTEYNKRALRPQLKAKLGEFVTLAKTVDFKAATQDRNGRKVFVNPTYERKSSFWKLLYRAGAGATGAAVQVAQAWMAEL